MHHFAEQLQKVSSLPYMCPYRPPGALEDEPKKPGAQREETERALKDSESVISPCATEHELYKQIAISRRRVSKVSEAVVEEKR